MEKGGTVHKTIWGIQVKSQQTLKQKLNIKNVNFSCFWLKKKVHGQEV